MLDEATYSGRRAGSVPAAVSNSLGAPPKMPNGVAKPTSTPLVDLLDLSSDDVPAASSSGGDFLHDLLGVDLSPASQGWFFLFVCVPELLAVDVWQCPSVLKVETLTS